MNQAIISVPAQLAAQVEQIFPHTEWNAPDVSAQIIEPVVTMLIGG